MKKREIIDIMYKSAQLFEQNLKNKNLLIIYGNVNFPKIIETRATDDNFLHLTGIENVNSSVTPAKFYKNILALLHCWSIGSPEIHATLDRT